MSHHDDLDWLIEEVGLDEDTALDLLNAVDWAEMKRMIDKFGYPKDNAMAPTLPARLADPRFIAECRRSIADQGDAGLSGAFERVLEFVD